MRSKRLWLPATLAGLALLMGQQFLTWPGGGLLASALNNAFHTLLFFLLTPLVCLLLRALRPYDWPALARRAAAVGLFLALLSEALQFAGPRDASPLDILLDTLGIAAALSLLQGLRLQRTKRPRAAVWILLAMGLLLVGFSRVLYLLLV